LFEERIYNDNLNSRRVVCSPSRGERPNNFTKDIYYSPFKKGSESLTPQVVYSYPDDADWRVRVVPNKYTPFSTSKEPYGIHEILIETPFEQELSSFSEDQILEIIDGLIDRVKCIARDKRIKYIALFKNHGEEGGASIRHPHMQIVGLDYLPNTIERRVDFLYRFYKANSNNTILSAELMGTLLSPSLH